MRVLIVSDSHGDRGSLKAAAEKTRPDQILHLGDYLRDAVALAQALPGIPVTAVSGNCDTYDRKNKAPEECILTLEGHRVLLCHGHCHNVKAGTQALARHARQQNARVCLFGHTHVPHLSEPEPGLLLINPGSIGASVRREYALLEITAEEIRCQLKTL